MKVVIFRGAPGSGKSYETDRLAASHEFVVVCSADHYMVDGEGNYAFDVMKLGYAHDACYRKFVSALEEVGGYEDGVVVVDNTNSEAWEFAPYVAEAKRAGATIEIVTLRGTRQNVHGVDAERVAAMRAAVDAAFIPYPFRQYMAKE